MESEGSDVRLVWLFRSKLSRLVAHSVSQNSSCNSLLWDEHYHIQCVHCVLFAHMYVCISVCVYVCEITE